MQNGDILPSAGTRSQAGVVPPDLGRIARDLLELAIVCADETAGRMEAEALISIAAELKQLHQRRGDEPRGVTVDEILDEINRRCEAERRLPCRRVLCEVYDWIEERSKPEPGVTGAGQPADGEAVAEEQQQEELPSMLIYEYLCYDCGKWHRTTVRHEAAAATCLESREEAEHEAAISMCSSDEGGADPSAEGDVESQAPGGG